MNAPTLNLHPAPVAPPRAADSNLPSIKRIALRLPIRDQLDLIETLCAQGDLSGYADADRIWSTCQGLRVELALENEADELGRPLSEVERNRVINGGSWLAVRS